MDTFDLPPFQPAHHSGDAAEGRKRRDSDAQHSLPNEGSILKHSDDLPWFTASMASDSEALFGLSSNLGSITSSSDHVNAKGRSLHGPGSELETFDFGYHQRPEPVAARHLARPNVDADTDRLFMKKTPSMPNIDSMLPPWNGKPSDILDKEPEAVLVGQPPISPHRDELLSLSRVSVNSISDNNIGVSSSLLNVSSIISQELNADLQRSPSVPTTQLPSAQFSREAFGASPVGVQSSAAIPQPPASSPHQPSKPSSKDPSASASASPLQAIPQRFCTRCGHQTTASSNFCGNCGLQLIRSPAFPDFTSPDLSTEFQKLLNLSPVVPPMPANSEASRPADRSPELSGTGPTLEPRLTAGMPNAHPRGKRQQDRVHPVISFGFGGRAVYTFPHKHTRYSATGSAAAADCLRPGLLQLSSVGLLSSSPAIVSSGPYDEKTKPRTVATSWILGRLRDSNDRCERVLGELLLNAAESNGNVLCAENERMLLSEFKIECPNKADGSPMVSGQHPRELADGDLASAHSMFLRSGDFASAFAVSGLVSKDAFADTLTAFYHSLPSNSILKMILAVFGVVSPENNSEGFEDYWETILLLSIRYKTYSLLGRVSERLAGRGMLSAASLVHVVGSLRKPLPPIFSSPLACALLNELYEYVLALAGGGICDQSHKVLIAEYCADTAQHQTSLSYCRLLRHKDVTAGLGRRIDLLEDRLEHSSLVAAAERKSSTLGSIFGRLDFSNVIETVIGTEASEREKDDKKLEEAPIFKTPSVSHTFSAPAPHPPASLHHHHHNGQGRSGGYDAPSESVYSSYGYPSGDSYQPPAATRPFPTATYAASEHASGTYPYQQLPSPQQRQSQHGQLPYGQAPYGSPFGEQKEPSGQAAVSPHLSSSYGQHYEQAQYSRPSAGDDADNDDLGFANGHMGNRSTANRGSPQPSKEPERSPSGSVGRKGVFSMIKSLISTTPSSSSPQSAVASMSGSDQPTTTAKLGEQSRFRYDEALKRWVEEGKGSADSGAPSHPPPPLPLATAQQLQQQPPTSLDYRNIKKHFDPFNLSSSSSSAAASIVAPPSMSTPGVGGGAAYDQSYYPSASTYAGSDGNGGGGVGRDLQQQQQHQQDTTLF